MKETLISVIIPVYNVEKYLPACVESVLAQTYRNLQIILVNDGSTDSSGEILEEYARKDERITVIHQENGGLSAARNTGLRAASGAYVTFLDSDDYVTSRMVEKLVRAVQTCGADIGICDYQRVGDDPVPEEEMQDPEMVVYSNAECLKHMYRPKQHGMEFVAWAKLYNRELFFRNQIEFPVGKLHEDTFTTYQLVYHANKAVFISDVLYCYRVRSGSIMTSSFNLRRCAVVEATEAACRFFYERGERELLQYALNAHLRTSMTLYFRIKKHYHGPEQQERLRSILLQGRKALVKYAGISSLPNKKRVFYTLFFHIPVKPFARMVGIRMEHI